MRGWASVGLVAVTAFFGLPLPAMAQQESEAEVLERSRNMLPEPPWGEDDERGMANQMGPGTWLRCARELSEPGAKLYELSHLRSNTMPLSPFGVSLEYRFRPTVGIPGTKHAFNGEEVVSGEPGAQGTQMDALGHFAHLDEAWNGQGDFPADGAHYYGGRTQQEVKPSSDSPLLHLGIEHAPPIVTSAVLLDAKAHLGDGEPLKPGQMVTRADIEAMLESQGLGERGLQPGDVLYVYTGWGDNWQDPDTEKRYCTMGPGLARDAAEYIEEKRVVLVALDNPFTDPVAEGQLRGEAAPPQGMEDGLPFVIHHQNLAISGIHQIQNAKLDELAADEVWTSCTMILPLLHQGASGSPVRPVAIGVPGG
jgi:kynurenine formamidase